jgi:hypothetical protein
MYRLEDFSWLIDENYNEVCGPDIFNWDYNERNFPEVKIVEEGLKIPINDPIFKGDIIQKDYLDTMIEYKGKRYFTKKDFIDEY